MTAAARVTVVVPVYRGAADVRRCVDSVLAHPPTSDLDVDVVVIDDASPEPDVREELQRLSGTPAALPVRVVRNERNLGFVATVNRAFAESPADVVVLNSDTVVTAGWLDRLADAARLEGVASVTPLTNFGSICTLPEPVVAAFGLDTDEPRIEDCAAFVAGHSLRLRPEIISGVGFCMYVTRTALDVVGYFDAETFGAGYGEEVDWCLRATRLGFRHLAEDSTFVYHRGGGSFGPERAARLAASATILHDRYRFFRAANVRERAANPLAVPFAALELGLEERRRDRPHVLHLLHSSPEELGGTEKHLHELIAALSHDFDFSILYPVTSGFVLRALWPAEAPRPQPREFLLPGGPTRVTGTVDRGAAEALRMAIDAFDVDAVHIQNLIGHSLAAFEVLRDFSGPVVCSVRDLYLACPHHWLLYRNQVPCGIPEDLSVCAECLPETRALTVDALTEHRAAVAAGLASVDHWVFASQSAADYFARAYDIADERVVVIPHGAIIDPDQRCTAVDEALVRDEPLRLAFVGMGWSKKGLDVVNMLADELAGSSIEIHHFGVSKEPTSPNVVAHGPYDNRVLPVLLRAAGVQIVLLPGVYAETFGHVMTEALVAGLPVIGAQYGALAERIRAHGCGWTVDPLDSEGILQLVQRLDHSRDEVLRATAAAVAVPLVHVAATADRYAALYRSDAGRPHESRRIGDGACPQR